MALLVPGVAALAAPDAPWHAALSLAAFALGARAVPTGPWTALGVAALAPSLARGPFGGAAVAVAIVGLGVAGGRAWRDRVTTRTRPIREPDCEGTGRRGPEATPRSVEADAGRSDAAQHIGEGPSLGLALLAIVAVLAAKQLVASGALAWLRADPVAVAAKLVPAATLPVSGVVIAGVLSAGAVASLTPRASRGWAAAGLLLASAVPAGRAGGALSVSDPWARLAAAERLDAVGLVYGRLLARATRGGAPDAAERARRPNDLLRALVRAAPERDAAALALGWRAALDLGWRPAFPEPVLVPVAEELERRGRGGEALRLLARAPREGDVDWLRALFEVTQGEPVRWRGGRGVGRGGTLPGAMDVEAEGASSRAIVFTALAGTTVSLSAATEGEGRVVARLDAGAPIAWTPGPEGAVQVLGVVEPGPHRIGLRVEGGRLEGSVRVEGR